MSIKLVVLIVALVMSSLGSFVAYEMRPKKHHWTASEQRALDMLQNTQKPKDFPDR